MKKLLVTGASGFLGWNICQVAQARWQVYGTYHAHRVEYSGVNFVRVNLTDVQALKDLFNTLKPDAVIHAAAQSKPNFCQLHPDETYLVNVMAAIQIAELCGDRNIPCAFTSTDLVFDGLHPPYTETDPVSPSSYYGEQKVLAEQTILAQYPRTSVCRMPLMFGLASPWAESFIQSFLRALQAGQDLKVFTDEFRTPVSGVTAAQGLLLALETDGGLFHLGGIDRVSRYDFVKLMAEVFELSPAGIKPCLQKDVPMPAPRPTDVSLNSSKAFSWGYKPLSLRTELEQLKGRI
ncbi:MAG: SDR family oxidoreductase [Microcoleaceae cyanobacterium]